VDYSILTLSFPECFPKREDESEDTKCAVVSSEVIVTAASLNEDIVPSELQAEIAGALKIAFTDNGLASYLE
jgi:hypothetical protein